MAISLFSKLTLLGAEIEVINPRGDYVPFKDHRAKVYALSRATQTVLASLQAIQVKTRSIGFQFGELIDTMVRAESLVKSNAA